MADSNLTEIQAVIRDTLRSEIELRLRDIIRSEVDSRVGDLVEHIDRRITDLSTEINATVQMVDFSEVNLSTQLAQVRDQIGRVLDVPSAATHNSGVELEAVIEATEGAANRIMESAEAIAAQVAEGGNSGNPGQIAARLTAIFEACAFQDLTSQRIRRAVEQLQRVEAMLANLAKSAEAAPAVAVAVNPDLDQRSVDGLLTGT
jgi:hypothetical protein